MKPFIMCNYNENKNNMKQNKNDVCNEKINRKKKI